MTTPTDYLVRIASRHMPGTPSAVVFVTVDGTPARVRWRGENNWRRSGRPGYICDEHGTLEEPGDCVHADLADAALFWREEAEAARSGTQATRAGTLARAQSGTVGEGSGMSGKRMASTGDPCDGGA